MQVLVSKNFLESGMGANDAQIILLFLVFTSNMTLD